MKQQPLTLRFLMLICGIGLVLSTACNQKTISLDSNQYLAVADTFQARIWPSQGQDFNFAEKTLNLPQTGICMSGGGSRAMVCAIGQLKGLMQLGLFDEIGYLSCVSGGSWASVPFTYVQSDQAVDERLLGTIVPPGELTLDGMSSLEADFLAAAASTDLLVKLSENLAAGVPLHEIWVKSVKQAYMQPFGVYDPQHPRYFSYDAQSVADIIRRNPQLREDDFITVHDVADDVKRPFLVVNSSIVGPYDLTPFKNPEQLSVCNYTPLYIGSAMGLTAEYTQQGLPEPSKNKIGNGFIEPFAFGGITPIASQNCSPMYNTNTCLSVPISFARYSAGDASGTSSSAIAALATSHGFDGASFSDLITRENYWPIPNQSNFTKNIDFVFGDGGNLENLGVNSLLQRKVHKLVVFVNTDVAVNVDYQSGSGSDIHYPGPKDVSNDVLTLFGIPFEGSEDMNRNQVFAKDDILELMQQLIRKKDSGISIIAHTSFQTLQNDWWGIEAGDTVEMVWVYNDGVPAYNDQLDQSIRSEIDDSYLVDFPFFPLYRLIGEDSQLVKLSPKQINLLYQFCAWNVYSNADQFSFLSKK
ncbi:MAG: hypothetical protein AAF206_06290 [Bacteroidota bacterium]